MGGYQEDHFWTNIRIILCMVCCAFGCYAQFGTKKFPKDMDILTICVGGYFCFSGILTLVDYFHIKASVMCVKFGDVSVFVDVNLPQFSDEVTMELRSADKTVSHKTSVGASFVMRHFSMTLWNSRNNGSLLRRRARKISR